MAKKLNAFTDNDSKRIANAVLRVEGTTRGLGQPGQAPARGEPMVFLTPGGGIAARSGSTCGSASCTMYSHIDGALASTGTSYTVYNPFGSAIGASAYIVAIPVGGSYLAISEDCG